MDTASDKLSFLGKTWPQHSLWVLDLLRRNLIDRSAENVVHGSNFIYKARPLALTCVVDPQQIPAVATHRFSASFTKQPRVLVPSSFELGRHLSLWNLILLLRSLLARNTCRRLCTSSRTISHESSIPQKMRHLWHGKPWSYAVSIHGFWAPKVPEAPRTAGPHRSARLPTKKAITNCFAVFSSITTWMTGVRLAGVSHWK